MGVVVTAFPVAAIAALTDLPDRWLIAWVLYVFAGELVVLSAVLRRPWLLPAAPITLAAAWLLHTSELLGGDPHWYTVPSGLALLGAAGLARIERRASGRPVATPELIAVEDGGMALVVVTSLARAVAATTAWGLLAIGLGAGLCGYGIVTHVRRRAAFGAGTVVLALLLMLLVPLSGVLPEWHGPALWLTLATAGLVAIVAAAFVESAVARTRQTIRHLREITSTWE
jgi:hypothetical protein